MDSEQKPLQSGFGATTTAAEVISGTDLRGKMVVITGGHSGIGLETTRVLSEAGASVFVGARDLKKAQTALADIKNVEVVRLELSDPRSVDEFAQKFLSSHGKIDILINNAGTTEGPVTRDSRGYEMQFATNHLGHFRLTARLWEALKKAGSARVISLSSVGHRYGVIDFEDPNFLKRPYDKSLAYGQSKTANSLFAIELDQKGKEFGIRSFALHPGAILTGLTRNMKDEELKAWNVHRVNGVLVAPPGFKTIEQGAATTVWCAVSAQLNGKGGVYCADCDIAALVADDSESHSGVRRWAVDKEAAKKLWSLSERLTDVKWPT